MASRAYNSARRELASIQTRDAILSAGDFFFVPPGHRPYLLEDTELLQITDKDEFSAFMKQLADAGSRTAAIPPRHALGDELGCRAAARVARHDRRVGWLRAADDDHIHLLGARDGVDAAVVHECWHAKSGKPNRSVQR